MRTNIEIDDELMERALEVTGLPTKRAVVDEALRDLVGRRSRLPLSDLVGTVQFAEGYDYKALRIGQGA